MFITLLILSICYFAILLFFSLGLFRLKDPKNISCRQNISVIVAARNEERNIENLLRHLLRQNYPKDKYEIIIVDDRSQDQTVSLIERIKETETGVKLESIPTGKPGGKKRALAKGIDTAKHSLLAFTDADCLPSPEWLAEINRHFTPETDFVAGYSPLIRRRKSHSSVNNEGDENGVSGSLSGSESIVSTCKNLERLSVFALMAAGMGWNIGLTCTGRNIAYRKPLFYEAGGFSGLEDIPSGDDDLLLHRMSSRIRKMSFMFSEESSVPSYDNDTVAKQINMETRRASKWKLYPVGIKLITAEVFLFYLLLTVAILLMFFGVIAPVQLIIILLIKAITELLLLTPFLIKMKKTAYLTVYPVVFLLHIPYLLFFAIKGTFGSYKWK